MTKIGIIGAMGSEVELLKTRLTDCQETVAAGRHFYSGNIGSAPVVLVCSGIGKVNSAVTCQLLIDLFHVSAVINTGVAGGAGKATVRDVVVSTDAVYHDMDQEILSHNYPFVKGFTADPTLVQLAMNACAGKVTAYAGRIATGDQFICERAVRDDIVARTQPMAIEMEGGSIAHTCAVNSIPFVIIRSISDNADDDAEMSFETFEKIAANDAAEIVTAMLHQM